MRKDLRPESELEYTVIVKDGVQFLCLNGEILPRQVSTEVEQTSEMANHGGAMVKMYVRASLVDTINNKEL